MANQATTRAAPARQFSDVKTLRERARRDIEEGAVTANYGCDKETVLRLLNEALATELVCTLRYRRHQFTARGLASQGVADEFQEHAREELEHADRIAERIVELGGNPNFSPDGLSERSHAEYVEADSLQDMIRENLVAERIAIESYREIVRYVADGDPTTRRLFEEILATEEEHAEDLISLMQGLG
ncbi:MAG TPA: ferritin-like domain-containing protein [Burkholderiaceae bacterium]|nr:ferritin-like domain-containing protein [Burkholderiaceae bacterium]